MEKTYSADVESKEIDNSAENPNQPNKAKDFGSDLYEIANKYAELLKENQSLKSQLKEMIESLKIINTTLICKDYEEAKKLLQSIIFSNLKN